MNRPIKSLALLLDFWACTLVSAEAPRALERHAVADAFPAPVRHAVALVDVLSGFGEAHIAVGAIPVRPAVSIHVAREVYPFFDAILALGAPHALLGAGALCIPLHYLTWIE